MSSIIDTGFISTAELKNVGYINKVENVNWPPKRVKKLTFRALVLRHSL